MTLLKIQHLIVEGGMGICWIWATEKKSHLDIMLLPQTRVHSIHIK